VVLTSSRLVGFPFDFSDPYVHEIAMVLRSWLGVIDGGHDEISTLPEGLQTQTMGLVRHLPDSRRQIGSKCWILKCPCDHEDCYQALTALTAGS